MRTLTRFLSLLLVLVLLASLAVFPVLAAPTEGVTIKLHYSRADGNYDNWTVWFWNLGADGASYNFTEEDGEMVATYAVASDVSSVGFIVRLGNWEKKDVDKDQFIDVGTYLSGTVHVYVNSGVEGYTTKLGKDVVVGIKVRSCAYKEGLGIRVTTSAPIEKPEKAFTITGPNGEKVAIASVTAGAGNLYTLKTEQPLSLFDSYKLTFNEEDYKIQMPNVYSTQDFESQYTYTGNDLGATWSKDKTAFRVWAPTAAGVTVNLYETGDPANMDLMEQLVMKADSNGTWVAEKTGDLNGVYYTYSVTFADRTVEACDPYARTTGVNGKRAMVIDLASTNPEGWENDKDPHAGNAITDAVIYELHVRDLSMDESSGIQNKGKYLGLIETGTKNPNSVPTGLDHIKDLGITHLHLLPIYDFGSVDESNLNKPQFNWGYDPVNYNVPEGSYATDPYKGEVRVKEMKQMVKGLHDNGISVVMDVVYNHVYNAEGFCFNQIVPQYFSRVGSNGTYSNGSGCGNDTASERAMVQKYIVDSVLYWAEEYHIDGFRFDLVGLIDTETINAVVAAVHEKHPNVIFYGEGWTMTTDVTKEGYTMTTQVNSTKTPDFAFFSDTIRDALKGSVFDNNATGYVSGGGGSGYIASCFAGAPFWCKSPTQTVNYASCHDNMTLFDRLTQSAHKATVEDRIRMNNLAAAIYMTSQGIPFFQAGEEMLRSKPLGDGTFDHNSYASSDAVNSLKWNDLNNAAYQNVYNYYKGLIAFRKAHPALRMTSAADVSKYISSPANLPEKVHAFQIAAGAGGESEDLFVIFNPNAEAQKITLPEGNWAVYINGEKAGTTVLDTVKGDVSVAPISAMVLVRTNDAPANRQLHPAIIAAIAAAALAVVAGAAFLFMKKRKA